MPTFFLFYDGGNYNILMYVSSVNNWTRGDYPLAQLVTGLDLQGFLIFITVYYAKALGWSSSRDKPVYWIIY